MVVASVINNVVRHELIIVPLLLWHIAREHLNHVAEEARVAIKLEANWHLAPFQTPIATHPLLIFERPQWVVRTARGRWTRIVLLGMIEAFGHAFGHQGNRVIGAGTYNATWHWDMPLSN